MSDLLDQIRQEYESKVAAIMADELQFLNMTAQELAEKKAAELRSELAG